jgi:flagellar protein FlgJ
VTDALSSTSAQGALASAAAKGAVQPTAATDKLKSVAKQFEAVFMRQLIGSMRSSSMGDGILDSSATQQFRDMSDSKLADSMADKGVLHVADLLVKQFGAKLSGSAAAGSGAAASGTASAAATKGEAK